MNDLSPNTEYPHQTFFRWITFPIVFILFVIISIGVMEEIENAMPKRRHLKYAKYARVR